VASVARAVLATIADPDFLAGVRTRANLLEAGLRALAARTPSVTEVRGRGLLWGVELDRPAAPVVAAARERGLLLCSAGPEVVRVVPPLNLEPALIERGLALLEGALS
jgi:acetylornithine/succinyldiaminopimelate/putrescine aminotransferase